MPARRALAALALALLVAPAPAAAAELAPLSLADVARLRSVREVAIAPDGELVAFVLAVPRRPWEEDDGPAWAELRVVDRAGRERSFVTGEVNVRALAWSSDGSEIAFLAKRQGDEAACLYAIARDGGEARRRLCHETAIEEYALAADGRHVAFVAHEKRGKEAEERREKGFDAEVFEESWLPARLFVAELDPAPGAQAAPRRLELPGSASELSWAGERLLVALAPTPSVDDGYMARRLHLVAPEDGKVLGRVEHEGKLGSARLAPDGSRLAFVGAADRKDPSTARFALAGDTGGLPRDLLPAGFPAHVQRFVWAGPERLLAVVDRGVETELVAFAAGGGSEPLLAGGGPVWSGLDRAADGSVALVGESPGHPPEVFFWDPASEQAPRRLTDSNPWLAERRLAPQRVVRFAARDGLELEGLLIEPLGGAAGRVPLVVVVHGGPEAHFADGWLTRYANPGQVLAARGIAVFYPNYRGSTGRGLAFSKVSQGDPAGAEFDDLVDAVDHLVAAGLADPARVGITGGSYGGYATAWAATRQSERFAAGVMFVGISELATKAGTTDIPVEDEVVHFLDAPHERFDLARERSPLSHVARARTPLLIAHGDSDPRVHPSQSLALYRYLKRLGQAPVRLVRYPGEGHGNRRAASQLDFSIRLVEWFERYLGIAPGEGLPPAEPDYGRILGLAEETPAAAGAGR
ncbi:MAG: S9 family peptidase [Thermoanaerobaculia bacterium]|nr:S9 family peptidase [Thermoanaerobaculia bacterium]